MVIIKKIVPLHLLFLLYSFCGILGKLAASREYLSAPFFAFYLSSLLVLVVYSLLWQRILAIMPLTTAFGNKGITVVWGVLWGALFFNESITVGKVAAMVLILTGIVIIGGDNG